MRLVLVLLTAAAPVFAQGTAEGLDHPVVLIGGQYGAPTRLLGAAGVLIAPLRPFKPGDSPDSSRAGLVVAGSAGTGGFRAGAGVAALALEGPFLTTGFDALFTVTRTTGTPLGASGDSTYVGGEAGLVIMSVRLSAGVAHRAAGPTGSKAMVFTWSVGVQIPVGW
jgi:hypothetical protein